MKSSKVKIAVSVLVLWSLAGTAIAGTFPDFGYTPPSEWSGRMFELSQDYPPQEPQAETVPWKTIDFKTQPAAYMNAVLDYCYEGNLEIDFVVQQNGIRKWFHAPWLHWGPHGRDFVRGLTGERASRPYELALTQSDQYRNFAVGFYNARGAYTIGRVWRDSESPDSSNVRFLEDTVSFKLLFTTASSDQVPYIDGSPEWFADIDRSPNSATIQQTKVRLLQLDIAVRDNRSNSAGWVFGTFQYDAGVQASSAWKRLTPVTLMWGNDPGFKQSDYDAGQKPVESWINHEAPLVAYRSSLPVSSNAPQVLGWAGRGNGPVDNSVSSCLSCHSTAQIPVNTSMIPPNNTNEQEKLRWFRNLHDGESFDRGSKTLDFSLQLGVGIHNHQEFTFYQAGGLSAEKARALRTPTLPSDAPRGKQQQFKFSRDPDPENKVKK